MLTVLNFHKRNRWSAIWFSLGNGSSSSTDQTSSREPEHWVGTTPEVNEIEKYHKLMNKKIWVSDKINNPPNPSSYYSVLKWIVYISQTQNIRPSSTRTESSLGTDKICKSDLFKSRNSFLILFLFKLVCLLFFHCKCNEIKEVLSSLRKKIKSLMFLLTF